MFELYKCTDVGRSSLDMQNMLADQKDLSSVPCIPVSRRHQANIVGGGILISAECNHLALLLHLLEQSSKGIHLISQMFGDPFSTFRRPAKTTMKTATHATRAQSTAFLAGAAWAPGRRNPGASTQLSSRLSAKGVISIAIRRIIWYDT